MECPQNAQAIRFGLCRNYWHKYAVSTSLCSTQIWNFFIIYKHEEFKWNNQWQLPYMVNSNGHKGSQRAYTSTITQSRLAFNTRDMPRMQRNHKPRGRNRYCTQQSADTVSSTTATPASHAGLRFGTICWSNTNPQGNNALPKRFQMAVLTVYAMGLQQQISSQWLGK